MLRLYFDSHVRSEIRDGLRSRGVDVLTSQDDGAEDWSDSDLLDRATAIGRVMFTQDIDFVAEAVKRLRTGQPFGGVIYAHQLNITIGRCIDDLELAAKVYDPIDMDNRLLYLPL